ncbi:AraC family transcriptional regulator [Microbacterium kunmingense]|uniref:AraC family transcriptional regulator n=1 Tax=Microbacterium kunmingense TaxID=2915939 RepID=UPI003D757E1D
MPVDRLPGGFIGSLLAGDLVLVSEGAGLALAERAELWAGALEHEPGDAERRAAELEVEALLRRIAARRTEVAPGHPGVKGTAGEMAAFISERSGDDLRVEDVARHVHLQGQYAMTLFRRALGITIGEYLLQCRVARAATAADDRHADHGGRLRRRVRRAEPGRPGGHDLDARGAVDPRRGVTRCTTPTRPDPRRVPRPDEPTLSCVSPVLSRGRRGGRDRVGSFASGPCWGAQGRSGADGDLGRVRVAICVTFVSSSAAKVAQMLGLAG